MEPAEKLDQEIQTAQTESAEQPEPAAVQTETDVQEKEEKPEKEHFLGDLMDIAEAGILTMFLVMLVFTYIVRPVSVDGSSMNPTLLNLDRILVVRPLYEPKNGQIIVIDDQKSGIFSDASQQTVQETTGSGMVLVKRLIAKAGQEIDIDFDTGEVKVDGKLLNEPYIADPTTRDEGAFQYPFTVPEGYVFAMGDNRLHSMDSRDPSVGLLPENEILGTALVRFDRDDENCSKFTDRFDYLF